MSHPPLDWILRPLWLHLQMALQFAAHHRRSSSLAFRPLFGPTILVCFPWRAQQWRSLHDRSLLLIRCCRRLPAIAIPTLKVIGYANLDVSRPHGMLFRGAVHHWDVLTEQCWRCSGQCPASARPRVTGIIKGGSDLTYNTWL
jgi:hypothetical protein